MKKLSFFLLAIVFIFTSCGGTNPTTFNDSIVKANTTISQVFATYTAEIFNSSSLQSFDVISAQTDSALVKIDAELATVKGLEVPKGGNEYKSMALKAYQCLRDVVETGRKYSTLTKESTEEDVDKINKEYQGKAEEYVRMFDDLMNSQAAFAIEVGYEVKK